MRLRLVLPLLVAVTACTDATGPVQHQIAMAPATRSANVIGAPAWNVVGTYDIAFSGYWHHRMEIRTQDAAGNFTGDGFSFTEPGTTWTVTGQVYENSLRMHIEYRGRNYQLDAVANIAPDGTLWGMFHDNGGGADYWFSSQGHAMSIAPVPPRPDLGTVCNVIGRHRLSLSDGSEHQMDVRTEQRDGQFAGDGFGFPRAWVFWDVSGTVDYRSISFRLLYRALGDDPGLTLDASGAINRDGSMGGTYRDSRGRSGTWATEPADLGCRADDTPPLIVPVVTGTVGNHGWYTSDVTVTWTTSDPESRITSPACGATTVIMDTNGIDAQCSATSAGGTVSRRLTIRRDATAPVTAFAGAQAQYTVDQALEITCSASDATSGIAASTCDGVSGAAYTFALGTHQLSAHAVDNAGLIADASAAFEVRVTNASLCALLDRWVTNSGVAHSLCVKLNQPSSRAFVNEVWAQSGKALAADKATTLVSLAVALLGE